MIQDGDYLLKENEELGGENDHKMIILLTFYPVNLGVHRICIAIHIAVVKFRSCNVFSSSPERSALIISALNISRPLVSGCFLFLSMIISSDWYIHRP